jgi:hypothetical protein
MWGKADVAPLQRPCPIQFSKWQKISDIWRASTTTADKSLIADRK